MRLPILTFSFLASSLSAIAGPVTSVTGRVASIDDKTVVLELRNGRCTLDRTRFYPAEEKFFTSARTLAQEKTLFVVRGAMVKDCVVGVIGSKGAGASERRPASVRQ